MDLLRCRQDADTARLPRGCRMASAASSLTTTSMALWEELLLGRARVLRVTDLLTRLVNGWPNSRIDELMPWKWATAETG